MVEAICDLTHDRLVFDYQRARPMRTALEAYEEGTGVCRDFTHLAISLCRAMNIPARYVNGYLGDIGVPPDPAPMDFNAWFEVYVGGKWQTFDARHNSPPHWKNCHCPRPRCQRRAHDPHVWSACVDGVPGDYRRGKAISTGQRGLDHSARSQKLAISCEDKSPSLTARRQARSVVWKRRMTKRVSHPRRSHHMVRLRSSRQSFGNWGDECP